MTLIVVAYDVNTESAAGRKRLRRVARVCENYGQRVQNSVFECWVDAAQWVKLRADLVGEIAAEFDRLRFEHVGAKTWLPAGWTVGSVSPGNPSHSGCWFLWDLQLGRLRTRGPEADINFPAHRHLTISR